MEIDPTGEVIVRDVHGCGVIVVVYPPALYRLIAALSGAVEAEAQAAARISELRDADGSRYAVADADGDYTCPDCGQGGHVPRVNLD